jgi:hypothetical protein
MNNIKEIIPNLFVTDEASTKNLNTFKYILCIDSNYLSNDYKIMSGLQVHDNYVYCKLDYGIKFIEEYIKNDKILIVCKTGRLFSIAFILAYICKNCNMNINDATKLIESSIDNFIIEEFIVNQVNTWLGRNNFFNKN